MRANPKLTPTTFFEMTMPCPATGCWLWMGSVNYQGYGLYHQNCTCRLAHRISWEVHHGTIPAGLFVCHKCDVPLCVNPDHLFLGDYAINNADRDAKGRQVPKPAFANPRAVLNPQALALIRADKRPSRFIAAELGVSSTTVRYARRRETYGTVP